MRELGTLKFLQEKPKKILELKAKPNKFYEF